MVLFLGALFITYSTRKLNTKQQHRVLNVLAVIISLTVAAFHVYYISLGGYNTSEDLPLYLCSFLALIIPVFTYYRKYWMYEILVFWIIAGTIQGIITPDILEGFPSFDYFRYWVVHLGLMLVIFYATFVLKMRPKFTSVFKSILALQLYMIVMFGVNYILNANYSYLNAKPKSASVLDYLGDWPYYILIIQLVLIPYFLLIYLPFYLTRKTNKQIADPYL